MQILFHAHHAEVSEWTRLRAERGVRKLAARLEGTVGANVRFSEDGPARHVEIVVHAPKARRLIATGSGKYWGPAIASALAALEQQIAHVKRTRKEQGRRAVDAGILEA